jgi:telomerase Cajal body protein 1
MNSTPEVECVAQYMVDHDVPESKASSKIGQVFCRNLQWSADGTCLLCTLSNSKIQTIVVPADLLESREIPHTLEIYSSVHSSEPVSAVTSFPGFDLQSPSTTLILSSTKEHPISLHSALTAEKLASYPLVDPLTEGYISPHSLRFTNDGRHFVAGSNSLVSTFDLSRPGQQPLSSYLTAAKRKKADSFNPNMSIRGIISALDLDQSSNILAAGTFGRDVGIYEANGQGECIGAFSVAGNEADKYIGGQGITQVLWSPCGTYLYIVERMSKGVMLYDIRKTGQLLSWLEGRKAITNQRLAVDFYSSGLNNHEVWAGGMDGSIRRWRDAHLQGGAISPDWVANLHRGKNHSSLSFVVLPELDPVASAIVHRTGGVLATCSGQRRFGVDLDDKSTSMEGDFDHSIRIWQLQ